MLAFFTLLIECLLLSIFQANGVEGRPVLVMLVAIGAFSVAYFLDLGRSRRLKLVATPLVLGYLMRLFLLLFDLYGRRIYTLPNSGADAEMFYYAGLQYAMGYSTREGAFISVVGTLFAWLGNSRIFVQFLLMLCSMVALHMAERVMETLDVEDQQRMRTMYILCLLPNFGILSSLFLRESIVTMIVSVSLVCFARWMTGHGEPWFVLAFIFAFCASRFHSGTMAVAVGYIAVRMLYDKRCGEFRFTWRNIAPTVFFLLVFVFLYHNYSDVLFGKMANVDSLEDIANTRMLGASSYGAYVGNSDNLFNMLIYTPLRLAFFLFSPFPWQWRGVSDVIAFCFSSAFYLWTLVRVISYLRNSHGKKRIFVVALLIIAVSTAFVFAWGTSNTGTAVRHRDKMVVLYAAMLALSSGTSTKNGKNYET